MNKPQRNYQKFRTDHMLPCSNTTLIVVISNFKSAMMYGLEHKRNMALYHKNNSSNTSKLQCQVNTWHGKIFQQCSYLCATLPSWISCTNIPSSPLFSLLSPTTLKPRPPLKGLISSMVSTRRPCSVEEKKRVQMLKMLNSSINECGKRLGNQFLI